MVQFHQSILRPSSFISPAILDCVLMLGAVVRCRDMEPLISRSSALIHLRSIMLKCLFWETLGAPSLEHVYYTRYAKPESQNTRKNPPVRDECLNTITNAIAFFLNKKVKHQKHRLKNFVMTQTSLACLQKKIKFT